MKDKLTTLKRTANLAGWLYLLLVSASLYSHVYVPSQLLVRDNAAATAGNIIANEFLFRTCIIASLLEVIVLLFLALVLYRLLREINNHLARLMVALACVQVPLVFVLAMFKLATLMILKNPAAQNPELSMLFLQFNGYGMLVSELLAGLWLLPFGLLVNKSRFIPRILGILLIVAGSGYVFDFSMTLLLPELYVQSPVIPYICFCLGEIPIMLWLLVKGIKNHLMIEIVSEPKMRTPAISLEFAE